MVYCISKLCQIQSIDPYNPRCLGRGSFKTAKIGRGRWAIIICKLLASGPPPVTPCSSFGFEETFKEGRGIHGGKRYSRWEEAFLEGNFQKTQNFNFFIVL